MKKKIQMTALTRASEFCPTSVDAEKRTADVVWSQGAKVLRQPFFDDPYYEELSMDPSSIRMGRLNGGAPLLNSHCQNDLSSVIGVVEKAWIDGLDGRATVRFSEREDVAPIWKDVQSGIVRNISVGYRVYKFVDVSMPNDPVRTLRAVDWEPFELSAVPVGADAAAGFRNEIKTVNECEIEIKRSESAKQEDLIMSEVKPAAPAAIEKPDQTQEISTARSEAISAERARVTEIRRTSRIAKLDESFSDQMISEGKSVDEVRAIVIEKMATAQVAPAKNHVAVEVDGAKQSRMEAAENALMSRMSPSKVELSKDGREFRGMTLLEIARNFIEARGTSTRGMSKMEIATAAFAKRMETTSDLPNLLANVQNKQLRMAYENTPRTFVPFCTQGIAPDFKTLTRVQMSDAPKLELVNEKGEVKKGYLSDGKETYSIATYAKILPITRQVLINDDLNAIQAIPKLFGMAASDLENDIVWGIITANAALADGVTLFYATTHVNLAGSGTALDVTNVALARKAMRGQKSLQGRPINVNPKFLLVSQGHESAAELVVGPIVPNLSSSVNPFSGKLSIIVEPRLFAGTTQPWYVAADPNQISSLEYSYLEGQEGVYLESHIDFDTEGMCTKARLDFGAKALDYRGLYKNPGT